ncbi:MAG: hypothetical protein HN768_11915 [Rhodospirillaceae bacterium]|nr:hypothetical protein [Rhodospirillaceae bacterium]
MKRFFAFVLFIALVASGSLAIRYDEYLNGNPVLGERSYGCPEGGSFDSCLVYLDDRRCWFGFGIMCERVDYEVQENIVRVSALNGDLREEIIVLEASTLPGYDARSDEKVLFLLEAQSIFIGYNTDTMEAERSGTYTLSEEALDQSLTSEEAFANAKETLPYQWCRSEFGSSLIESAFYWELRCLRDPTHSCPTPEDYTAMVSQW